MGEIALTIDLEFLEETHYPPESNVETAKHEKKAVRKLLDILEEDDQKITFFTVANLCDSHLEFLEEIRDRGHEIASHSYTHPNLAQLSQEELRYEIGESKSRLEEELNVDVKGFRAPELRTNQKVNKEIEKAGYTYDSSNMSSFKIPGWYGGEKSFRPYSRDKITEIPVSANPLTKTPISGFFFRLLGKRHLNWSIKQLHKRNIVPVIYLHPYELAEFDGKKNWRKKWKSGKTVLSELESILSSHSTIKIENLA